MFIVDMNRKITVNVDNVICITQESRRITAVTKVDDIILGTYSTEERAAEVYKDMLNNIFPQNFIVTREHEVGLDALKGLENGAMLIKSTREPEVKMYNCGVYYMPGEE